ncbi:MAG TPA: TetR/AcrR family transcriptional regulator [Caulobacterales bacterium]|nr:TetR/AcrR family transcriptional regulator [Caulobacterales bacterium]
MPKILTEDEIAEFRERLCDAAEKQFAAHGLEGVTIRALAGELGVSPMTPYRYFRNKEDILAAVQTRAFTRFSEALEAPAKTSASAAEHATGVARAYVEFALGNPEAYRLMFDIAQEPQEQGPPEDYPELAAASARARATMTAYVRALVAEGLMAGDPELIGHVHWAAIHGLVMLKLAGKLSPACDFDRVAPEIFRALREGFRPRG